jgi:DNA-binding MarR family transcriptional regulator
MGSALARVAQESDDLISVGLEERLLLAIWRRGGSRRRGGCAMGTSELAEEIGYSRDERGKVSDVLGKLREEGYVREGTVTESTAAS